MRAALRPEEEFDEQMWEDQLRSDSDHDPTLQIGYLE
jgi:hypothetical protein